MKSKRKSAKQNGKGLLSPPIGIIGNLRFFADGLVRINNEKRYTIRISI